MKRPLALALVALVFGVGIVVGVVGTHLYYIHRLGQPGAIADFALELGARQLDRELDLRPEQRQELEKIFADTRIELDAVRRDMVVRLRDIRDRSADRFETVLDPEQRAQLEKMRQEQGRIFDRYLR